MPADRKPNFDCELGQKQYPGDAIFTGLHLSHREGDTRQDWFHQIEDRPSLAKEGKIYGLYLPKGQVNRLNLQDYLRPF